MGIAAASEAQYEDAVRRLFPQGAYWDAQFADAQSDAALFAKAKAAELKRFMERRSALLDESIQDTTRELIADWERVYLDAEFPHLDLARRRLQLKSKNDLRLNRAELQKTAAAFGLNVKDVRLPYRPRFFGFAKFALERLGSFTTFSVVKITATEDALELTHWQIIKAEMERRRFARVRFGLNRLAYFPIYKRREIIYRKLRRGCFGYGRFAQNTLTPFLVAAARQTAAARLDARRVTKLFFGQSRLVFFAGRFDPRLALGRDYFGAYTADILQTANFNKRFERSLLDGYFSRASPYHEFEQAIRNKLFANQIPIFYYEGE
ncbi:MAG: hypothetical protein Pg6C_20910 [Treponemataceae bacterium]|nr:MAG: hypothetical protein Pg6C_20910 [Treponemataceae bacterium]